MNRLDTHKKANFHIKEVCSRIGICILCWVLFLTPAPVQASEIDPSDLTLVYIGKGSGAGFAAPTITSIARHNPTSATTDADQVVFRVTFDSVVLNVSTDDFAINGTAAGDGTVSSIATVSTSVYDVTVTGLTNSSGTINLDIKGNGGASGSNDITSSNSQLGAQSLGDTQQTGSSEFGQSFVPTISGSLTTIILKNFAGIHNFNGTGTLELRLGAGLSGTILASQSINITAAAGEKTYTFSTPANVTAGTTYTFRVNIPGGTNLAFSAQTGNPYSSGDIYIPAILSGADLYFKMFIAVGTADPLSVMAPPVDQTYTIFNPPTATNVNFSGVLGSGQLLTGSYTFTDSGGDAESGTTYRWLRSDDSNGTNKAAIAGATNTTYTITNSDIGKFISFEVTPSDGTDTGAAVESTLQGPVSRPAPSVSTIARQTPSSTTFISNQTAVFRVAFSRAVMNVSTDDFTLNSTVGGSIASVSAQNDSLYDVTVNSLNNAHGTLQLQIKGVNSVAGSNDISSGDGFNNGTATITQTGVNDFLNQALIGQSFQATTNNFLTAFTLFPRAGTHTFSGTARLRVYEGDASNSSVLNDANAIKFEGTVNVTSSTDAAGQTFTVANPPQLTAGQTYSVTLDNYIGSGTRAFDSNTSGNLANGNAFFTGFNAGSHSNFDFKINIFEGTQATLSLSTDATGTNESYTVTLSNVPDLQITGNEGWRMMTPIAANTSYATLLDAIFTQGYTGADRSTGTPNVLTYNEVTRQFEAPVNASVKPGSGKGFIAYIFSDNNADGTPEGFPKTIVSDSSEAAGSVSPSLTFTSTGTLADDGFNLVGNPYGTPIDWDAANGWIRTNLDATFYVWSDSANAGAGSYLTWNGTTGTLPNGRIAPWQGFWVKANTISPIITFTDTVRSTTSTTFFKEKEVSQIRFSLSSESNNMQSSTILLFDERANIEKDVLDAYKLQSLSSNYLSLFTQLDEKTALDINAIPVDLDGLIELDMDIAGSDLGGNYTLNWSPSSIPDGMRFLLVDHVEDQRVLLEDKSTYTFHIRRTQAEKGGGKEVNVSIDTPTHPVLSPRVLKRKQSTGPRFTLRIIPKGVQVSTEESSEIPNEVTLDQNFPNPFNPTTNISFVLPQAGEVKLQVFDLLGREVSTLVNSRQAAGRFAVSFDASSLSSGVYIYRLQAGNTVLTRKLTLIK